MLNPKQNSSQFSQQVSHPPVTSISASQAIRVSDQILDISNMTPQNSPQFSQQIYSPLVSTPPASQPVQVQPTLLNKSLTASNSFHHEAQLRNSLVIPIIPEIDFQESLNTQLQLDSMMRSYFFKKNITDSDFIESIEELCNCVEKKVLSELQFRIILDKLGGTTYDRLKSKYGIPSESTMAAAISRTAQGRYWDKSVLKGGREPILSDIDVSEFVQIVKERENDINCLSTCEAKQIAIHLQTQRALKAQRILLECGCEGLANNIRVQKPDKTWLLKMARRHGLSIVPSCELETMRRIACDKKAIEDFFDKHSGLLRRDPRLIFNMDETMVSSNRKFKVVVTKGRSALTESPHICPHITACITVGAAGYVMKPLYIIPNKKTIKGLDAFNGTAYFASTKSGWMNKEIFTYWGLLFLSEISLYRLSLPPDLRDQRILLLLDGHKSRNNSFIAMVFDIFKIDILIFPGHTSHILQAFDVSIASPLKTAYKEYFLLYDLDLDKIIQTLRPKKKIKEIRIMMIKCLNLALSQSANLSNIQSGFKASGICPLDKNVPLSSKYAMNNSMRERYPDLFEKIKNGNLVNNRHLNGSIENILYVFQAEFDRMPLIGELHVSLEDIRKKIRILHSSSVEKGKILTPVPDLICESNGTITRIHLDN